MSVYKVYKWTNTNNGGVYFGSTCNSIETRTGYKMIGYKGCKKFYDAIQEFGPDAFRCEIIKDGLTMEEANALEIELILSCYYDPSVICYNSSIVGRPSSEMESRRKRSETLHKERSVPEYRKIMSDRMKAVWASPERRKGILEARSSKTPGGIPAVSIKVLETGKVYKSCADCSRDIGISKSLICRVLNRRWNHTIKCKDGSVFTFIRL